MVVKVFIWIAVLVTVIQVQGQDDDMDEERSEHYRQCNKERRRVLVSLKKNLDICGGEKSAEGSRCDPATRGCIAKCVLEKEKMLNENGMVTLETAEVVLEERASERTRELAITMIKGCLDQYGPKMIPDDIACPGYEDFGHCVEFGMEKICEDPLELEAITEDEETPRDEL